MKSFLPLLSVSFLLIGFTSCTVYKSGQTPDDVYFSPSAPQVAIAQDEYVQPDNRNDKYYSGSPVNNNYNTLEDDYYAYNPNYYQSYNNFLLYTNPYYNNTWGNYSYYNYNSYNPYYGHVVIIQPASAVYNKPRRFNLNAYTPPNSNNNISGNNPIRVVGSTSAGNNNNYRGSNTNAGNFLRNVFSTGNSSPNLNTNTSNSSSSRSTTTPSSAPSRSSSSSSSSAPVRHF